MCIYRGHCKLDDDDDDDVCVYIQRVQLENALGPQRQKFVSLVARKLHVEQSWYHGNISREAADRVMSLSEHHDGKFL